MPQEVDEECGLEMRCAHLTRKQHGRDSASVKCRVWWLVFVEAPS